MLHFGKNNSYKRQILKNYSNKLFKAHNFLLKKFCSHYTISTLIFDITQKSYMARLFGLVVFIFIKV